MRLAFFIIGSGLGAPLRYLVDKYFRSRTNFPFGILVVNVVGSFILGAISTKNVVNSSFLVMGFCGALTSWSALALDQENEFSNKNYFQMFLNLAANMIFGIGTAFLAIKLF
jgi:CrcB protein